MDPENPTQYGEISQFKELVDSIENLDGKIVSVKQFLAPILEDDLRSKLSLEGQVQYDLFVSYVFSSLFWILMKTLGQNPASSRVKAEIDRVKEHAKRFKLIKERKTLPRINKDAAARFIRSGLWTPDNDAKPTKKRKRNKDD